MDSSPGGTLVVVPLVVVRYYVLTVPTKHTITGDVRIVHYKYRRYLRAVALSLARNFFYTRKHFRLPYPHHKAQKRKKPRSNKESTKSSVDIIHHSFVIIHISWYLSIHTYHCILQ